LHCIRTAAHFVLHGCVVLVAFAFSCARFAVVLQVLRDAVRETVGNAFPCCVRALARVIASVAVPVVAITFVILICHKRGN